MLRSTLLVSLAALAVPATAVAAPAKISPNVPTVSAAGATTISASNPNGYVLLGKATVSAAGKALGSKSVKLKKWSAAKVVVTFDQGALAALRASGGKATIKLALKRLNGKKVTATRTVTLTLPAAPQDPAQPAPAPAPLPGPSDPGAGPAGPGTNPGTGTPAGSGQQPAPAPVSTHFKGRMGTEGAYDDFEATVENGQITITKPPFVPVFCAELGGQWRSATSLEPFVVQGPWTIGQNGLISQMGVTGNALAGSSEKTINYKVEDTVLSGDTLTGKLGMSFYWSRLDFSTYPNKIININCSGTQSFEAVRS